jgi:hypothetical protein
LEERIIERVTAAFTAAMAKAEERNQERHARSEERCAHSEERLASATERSAKADVKLNSQEPFALTQERLEPAKPDSSEAARAEAQPDVLDLSTTTCSDLPQTHPVFVRCRNYTSGSHLRRLCTACKKTVRGAQSRETRAQ